MINDLPTHSVIPNKKNNCSRYPIFSTQPLTCFFLEKSRSQKPWTVLARLQVNCSNSYTLLKGPHFRTAKNWRNSGFVAKILTKFALFDDRKMAFWAAKSFGA